MSFSFYPLSMVGLNVTPQGFSLVHLKRIKQGFLVLGARYVPFSQTVFVDGKIKDWEKLTELVKEEVEAMGLTSLPAVICLPANLVRMQHLELPLGLDEHQIEEEIRARVHKDLPGLSEKLVVDFTFQPTKETDYANIFFVAVREEYLAQYEHAINQTGLKTKIAEVDIFALTRIVFSAETFSNQREAVQVIVYVCHGDVSLIVCHKREIIFHQNWTLVETLSFGEQLRNKLEFCWAELMRATSKQLILCMPKNEEEISTDSRFPDWEWHCFVLRDIHLGINVDAGWMQTHGHYLLMALGAAMREVPKW